jgi:Dockerin type I domain
MRQNLILTAFFILIPLHFLFAGNRVFPDPGIYTSPASESREQLIYIENEDTITELSMGFEVFVIGDFAFEIDTAYAIAGSAAADGLIWDISYSNQGATDTVYFHGISDPGSGFHGIPPGFTQALIIKINLDVCSNQVYWDTIYLCIDSCTSVPPSGNWSWNYTTPEYNDGNSPFCLDIGFVPCGWLFFDSIPDNDVLLGNHCDELEFQFIADTHSGYFVEGYGVCSDAPSGTSITSTGLFTFNSNDIGVYDVTIYAHSCGNPRFYSFTVELTNDGVGYKFCPTIPLYKLFGSSISYDFGLSSRDCDPITLETVTMISSPGSDPINTPSMTDGIFTWIPDQSEIGTWVFEVYAEDEFGAGGSCDVEIIVTDDISGCGDANSDSEVDVSDAVFIINFVFVGGAAPEHWEWANVNCDGAINVSDAVWIINYVFVGGAAPCEC